MEGSAARGVSATSFLCYPLGHAHENFNQALQITASSPTQHIRLTLCLSVIHVSCFLSIVEKQKKKSPKHCQFVSAAIVSTSVANYEKCTLSNDSCPE